MTRRIPHIIIFLTFFTFSFVSCNKSEKLTTPEDIIAGKWRLAATATDDNNNKILDAAELRNEDNANDQVTFAFHYGGAGVEEKNYYGIVTDYYFTWQILGNSQYLQRFMEGHDTLTQRILTFNPLNTTLLDTTGIVYAWYILKKY